MDPRDTMAVKVTIVSVDDKCIGSGRIKYDDLLKLIEEVDAGAVLVKLDRRFGGTCTRYVPVHRIAEIQVGG